MTLRGLIVLPVCCWFILITGSQVGAETMSVMQFNDKLREWKAEKKVPPPLTYTIEGRVSLYSKDRLRLKNCDVPFHSNSAIPELTRKSSNVEISGKIVVDPRSGEYSFDTGSIREVQSDAEKFHELRRRLRGQPAEKWYDLGRWAKERGDFYKDDELLKHSEEAYLHGFDLERKDLARDNPQGLLELAEKAKLYQLPSALRQELTHEAFQLLWQRSRKLPVAELEAFSEKMAGQLPGCSDQLSFFPSDLWKRYKAKPLETYAKADSATRRKIHRLLYCDVLLRTITPGLTPDGSNGFEIAARIDQLIPEQHATAETFRDKALAARAAEIKDLSRTQLLDLADRYRSRQQAKQAEHLIETWLTLRHRALDRDDTEGLLDLTDDYRRMLNRRDLADRLLIDAWKRNPKAGDIVERLEKEGYHLFEGSWLTDAEYNARPEGKLEKAIRAGRVEPGMTVSDVRRSLGEPVSLARAITAGQVTEIWSYGLADASHLVVRLVKRTGQAELTVVDVSQQTP